MTLIRSLITLLLASLLISFVGCGVSSKPAAPTAPKTPPASSADSSDKTNTKLPEPEGPDGRPMK